jgi:hypothetical protein
MMLQFAKASLRPETLATDWPLAGSHIVSDGAKLLSRVAHPQLVPVDEVSVRRLTPASPPSAA